MSDKKITNPETQNETEQKKAVVLPKVNKGRKIRNQSLFKRGTYSIVITAVVLAGIIVFNVLLNALSSRFMLEYDMSADKVNTISDENIDYIKDIDTEINVTMCALKDEYVNTYMSYYAEYLYGLTEDYSSYYQQTVNLIEKYNSYNSNINVKFMDTQDAAFADIVSKYSTETINYGDIIVSAEINGSERYKIVGFDDIYEITTDDTYAAYGYTFSTLDGNNIETALTSAIAYVTNAEEKKVAFLSGHSKNDYSESYRELLEVNNYTVDVIDDKIITEISDEYDAVFLVGPSIDFMESELSVLADYLDNGERYGKGLVFFADATAPYLDNLYGFLEEWGIVLEEGILFETYANNYLEGMPTTFGSYAATDDDIVNDINYCLTGYNMAITSAFEEEGDKAVTPLVATNTSVVNAPVGTSNDWTGYEEYETGVYYTVVQSQRTAYDNNSNLLKNNVIAFSSIEFIYSEYAEDTNTSNKNVAFAVAERAVGAEDTGISFVTKTITNESFSSSVTESAARNILVIFVVLLPLLCVATCIFVCIWRRRA